MFSHFRSKKQLGISLTEMLIAIGLIGTVSGVAITNTMNAGVNNEANNAKLLAALSSNVEHIFEQQVVENGLIPRELPPSSILQSKLNYKATSTITSSAALPAGCNASLPVTKFNFADKNQHVFASQQWVQETSREDHSTVCVSRGDESAVSTVYRNGQANTTTIASSHEELANATQNNTATTTINDTSTVTSTDGRDLTEFRVRFEDKTTGKELLVPSYTITAKCLNGENFTYSTNVTPEDAASYFLTNLVGDYDAETAWVDNELTKAQTEYATMTDYVRDPNKPEYTQQLSFQGAVNGIVTNSSNTINSACYNPSSYVWMGPFQTGHYPTDPGGACYGMSMLPTQTPILAPTVSATPSPSSSKPTYYHNNTFVLNTDKPLVAAHINTMRGYQNTLTTAFNVAKSVCTASGGMHCDSITSKTYTAPSFKIDKRTKCTVQLSGLNSPSNGAPSVTMTPVNATLTIDLKTTNVAEFKINTTTTGNGADLINAASTIVEKPATPTTGTSLFASSIIGGSILTNPFALPMQNQCLNNIYSSSIVNLNCFATPRQPGNMNPTRPSGLYSGQIPPGYTSANSGLTLGTIFLGGVGTEVRPINDSALDTNTYYATANTYGRSYIRIGTVTNTILVAQPPADAVIIEGPTTYVTPAPTTTPVATTNSAGTFGSTLMNVSGSTINTINSATNGTLNNIILNGANSLATSGTSLLLTGSISTISNTGILHIP